MADANKREMERLRQKFHILYGPAANALAAEMNAFEAELDRMTPEQLAQAAGDDDLAPGVNGGEVT